LSIETPTFSAPLTQQGACSLEKVGARNGSTTRGLAGLSQNSLGAPAARAATWLAATASPRRRASVQSLRRRPATCVNRIFAAVCCMMVPIASRRFG